MSVAHPYGQVGVYGVTIGGKECKSAAVVDGSGGTKIKCTVAEHVGKNLDVKVCVTKQCSTDDASTVPGATGGNGIFSYFAPTITSAFKASLFGWDAYITGTNFG